MPRNKHAEADRLIALKRAWPTYTWIHDLAGAIHAKRHLHWEKAKQRAKRVLDGLVADGLMRSQPDNYHYNTITQYYLTPAGKAFIKEADKCESKAAKI